MGYTSGSKGLVGPRLLHNSGNRFGIVQRHRYNLCLQRYLKSEDIHMRISICISRSRFASSSMYTHTHIYIYIYAYRYRWRERERERDPSTYLLIHVSFYLSIYLSIYLFIHLSIHLPVYLPIYGREKRQIDATRVEREAERTDFGPRAD